MIHTNTATVPCWDVYEITIPGNGSYTGKGVWARFINGSREVRVRGFYDGEKTWKIRFMPDQIGRWYWEAWSANQWLQAGSGEFECVPPGEGNHGPVQVWQRYHFRYADGTPYYPIGTTCYAWLHQSRELQEETLNTLAKSPFNKLRMCVFPKWYEYCRVEPELYPFAGEPPRNWNFNEFNPAFFRHLENAIVKLAALGIEADVILFHPYDHWGFANMGEQEDLNYLRYVVRRLAAFRNVWWSLANEYDLFNGVGKIFLEESPTKATRHWDRFFEVVAKEDPYGRLRSIHNGRVYYDHSNPLVSHASIQNGAALRDFGGGGVLRDLYHKPVIYDEVRYEGDVPHGWGDLSAEELVDKFWLGLIAGTYVGHGETYQHEDDILWWSKGGRLHGRSPARIAFLRQIMEEGPGYGWEPIGADWARCRGCKKSNDRLLFYFGRHEAPPKFTFQLGEATHLRAELLDVWAMTRQPLDGEFCGEVTLELPAKPFQAILFHP